VSSWSKKEIKRANKEKKRCKKMYEDWKDDEFNCGANKFIFGVMSSVNNMLETPQDTPSFYTLNDLQVYYNRDNKKYLLDIEIGFESTIGDSDIKYLTNLLKAFKSFILEYFNYEDEKSILLNTNKNTYKYIGNFNDDYWCSNDLLSLYNKLYIFVEGYKKLCKGVDKEINKLEEKGVN
jgi:hypothetical protein